MDNQTKSEKHAWSKLEYQQRFRNYEEETNEIQELKNIELKNSLEWYNSRIRRLVNSKKDFKIIEAQEEKKKKNEESKQSLRDAIKKNNICIMGDPKREKRTANLKN